MFHLSIQRHPLCAAVNFIERECVLNTFLNKCVHGGVYIQLNSYHSILNRITEICRQMNISLCSLIID